MAWHIIKELREESYIIMVIQLGSISRTNNCAHIFLSTFIDTMGQLIILSVLGNNNIIQCSVGVVSTHLFNDILVTWLLWSLGFGYNSALGIA